jgi:tetraacyldisaccharide 4'-kinase
MMVKTPAYWYRATSSRAPWIENFLTPLSVFYNFARLVHQSFRTPVKSGLPVVCIGNLVAGGAGKTPLALAVMKVVHDNALARRAFFLTRGHGGTERGPCLIDPARHSYKSAGDEALLLASMAPTVIAGNRAAGAKTSKTQGADLILMDDGLQNPGIFKDIKIVVIDGTMGFGNGKILPAGPLREPLKEGLAKADAFVIAGEDKRNVAGILPPGKPVFRTALRVQDGKMPDLDKTYVAFAGIGVPEKFFNSLITDFALRVAQTFAFADHHPYTEHDIEVLQNAAKKHGAQLLTTEKDALRLPAGTTGIKTLPVEMIWENKSAFIEFLKEKLESAMA